MVEPYVHGTGRGGEVKIGGVRQYKRGERQARGRAAVLIGSRGYKREGWYRGFWQWRIGSLEAPLTREAYSSIS